MTDQSQPAQEQPCAQCQYDREREGMMIHYHPTDKVERWADRPHVKNSADCTCPNDEYHDRVYGTEETA